MGVKKLFYKAMDDSGAKLTETETEKLYFFCIRKMRIYGIRGDSDYIKSFFDTEIGNYVVRRLVNLAY